jgi:hypothetical protein
MKHSNGTHSTERRKHARFDVVSDLIEPIVLRYAPDKPISKKAQKDIAKHLKTQPAILTSLSAGGLSIVTFLAPPHTKTFKMVLTIPGLDHLPIEGRVVRVAKKGETYNVGIQFTKIAKKYQKAIILMAEDDIDCNTRVSLGLPEACVKTCSFHELCSKTVKAAHWPKKKKKSR